MIKLTAYSLRQGVTIPFRNHYHTLNTCGDGGVAGAESQVIQRVSGF